MRQDPVESFIFAVVLLICYSSGVRSDNPDRNEDKEILERLERIYSMQISNETFSGKSKELKPRNPVPADWTDKKYLKPLKCSGSYAVAQDGFIRVPLDSQEPCSYEFLGSRAAKCTTAFYCKDKLSFKNEKCDGQFIKISDGTIGAIEMTCGQEAGFGNTPRVSRNHGSDIYVNFKGTLASECIVFCIEDSANQFDPKKHLKRNHEWKNFPQAGSCECGNRMELGGRVVGGTDASKFEFPWLGAVVYGSADYNRVVHCGASLISDMHALSAAHCFPKTVQLTDQLLFHFHLANFPNRDGSWQDDWGDPKEFSGWDLPKSKDEDENSIRVEIDHIIKHPLYSERPYEYDVAILVFKKKVDFKSAEISPVCLPRVNELSQYEDGTNMVVSGWGLIRAERKPRPRILRKVDLRFVAKDKCAKLVWDPAITHICAGDQGDAACKGDSGGPLISLIPGDKRRYVLAGIVSAGYCGKKGAPTLFADVKEIIQWVYHHTANGDAKWCPR